MRKKLISRFKCKVCGLRIVGEVRSGRIYATRYALPHDDVERECVCTSCADKMRGTPDGQATCL